MSRLLYICDGHTYYVHRFATISRLKKNYVQYIVVFHKEGPREITFFYLFFRGSWKLSTKALSFVLFAKKRAAGKNFKSYSALL